MPRRLFPRLPSFLVWRDPNCMEMAGRCHDLWFIFRQPCRRQHRFSPGWSVEPQILRYSEDMSKALTTAGVAHDFDAYGCGIHSYRYAERDIHEWWGPMFASLGQPDPVRFDHRRADPAFSVWGWTFEADPQRALEFLNIRGAGLEGITLTGSGRTKVTTATLFRARQKVFLTGAVEPAVRANKEGRIAFTVDQGPPHQHEQYTAEARALEAAASEYWQTREISFRTR